MGKFTILALLLALTLASCGAPGDVGVQQGTIDIDNVEVIDMQSLLDEAAEESKFSVFINSNIVMKTSGMMLMFLFRTLKRTALTVRCISI